MCIMQTHDAAMAFRSRVSDCWHWLGAVDQHGYGSFFHSNERIGAHRFAWILANGSIPDGLFVCHRCDNPLCVNPAHLFLGTHNQNMRDMSEKGRAARGEASGRSVLKEDDVRRIYDLRGEGKSYNEIGRMLGITGTAVGFVLRGKRWRHMLDQMPAFNPDVLAATRRKRPCGEDAKAAKLSETQVREIRASREPSTRIAKQYGVSAPMIRKIRLRQKWKHVA